MIKPAYLNLYKNGELFKRAAEALRRLECCDLCPWLCKVNRVQGELGVCKTGRYAKVASYSPHFGEERPLVGRHGSGTIFFSSCNMRCRFCQNYDISQLRAGREATAEELAEIMLELQGYGCHNINFVSPSHLIAQILEAVAVATGQGLKIPLVYNTGGYDSVDALRLLDGVVDVYMPDIKYMDEGIARELSRIKEYPQVVREAVKEMHRQVGDLTLDERGVALRGLLIRHLILPANLSQTDQVMRFVASEVSKTSYVNLMDQYYPCFEAARHPDLDRRITKEEFRAAEEAAKKAGLARLDHLFYA